MADNPNALADQRLQAAWVFIGRSPKDSANAIRAKVAEFTPAQYACFYSYVLFLCGMHYGPRFGGWVGFGFVAATSAKAELELGTRYRELIRRCTFKEFCDAYATGDVPALFDRHGVPIPDRRYFCDVMAPSGPKTVWLLKQYVDQIAVGRTPEPVLPLIAWGDYGYSNCLDNADVDLLDSLYVRFFGMPGRDPIALHDACMDDALLKYLVRNRIVEVSRRRGKSKYSRLLRRSPPPAVFRVVSKQATAATNERVKGMLMIMLSIAALLFLMALLAMTG